MRTTRMEGWMYGSTAYSPWFWTDAINHLEVLPLRRGQEAGRLPQPVWTLTK